MTLTCAYCDNRLYNEDEKRTGICDNCTDLQIQFDDTYTDIGHTPKSRRSDNN